ncbi:MAG TPA: DUF4383 domain-containing protein [Herpetosiphonaceae bacterium]
MGTRYFALIAGIVYLLVGLLGFVPPLLSAYTGPDLAVDAFAGNLLGLFPINVLHNLVHLAIGAWGIFSYRSFSGSVAFARGLAIFYGLLTILGLIPVDAIRTTFGLIPIHGADVILHALTALAAAYFGFVGVERPEFVDASRRR